MTLAEFEKILKNDPRFKLAGKSAVLTFTERSPFLLLRSGENFDVIDTAGNILLTLNQDDLDSLNEEFPQEMEFLTCGQPIGLKAWLQYDAESTGNYKFELNVRIPDDYTPLFIRTEEGSPK